MKRLFAGTWLVIAGCGIDHAPVPVLEGLSDCELERAMGDYIQSFDYPGWFTLLLGSGEEQFLDEIPRALQFVLDNRAAFVADVHPLQDIEPGEVIDGVEALNGCWGLVQTTEYADGSGSWVEAEAVIIDLEAGTLVSQEMRGVDGFDCSADPRPSIQVFVLEILSVEPDRLLLRFSSGGLEKTIAGVDPDGSLSYHDLAAFGYEVSLGMESSRSFTVDGDFMVTLRGEAIDTEKWFRFTCPE